MPDAHEQVQPFSATMFPIQLVMEWLNLTKRAWLFLWRKNQSNHVPIIAVPGFIFMTNMHPAHAKALSPSSRGELEITDLNRVYLDAGNLSLKFWGGELAWLDTGSHDNLASATDFVRVIEKRQGLKIACLEEIALYKNWMSSEEVEKAAHRSWFFNIRKISEKLNFKTIN